jgi:hypothetical protein
MTARTFPTGAVLSLGTGKMLSTFEDMWSVADFLAGRPLMTHNFASEAVHTQLRDRLCDQLPWLPGAIENCPDFDGIPRERVEAACRAWVAQVAAAVGDAVELIEPTEPIDMSFVSGLEHLGQGRR